MSSLLVICPSRSRPEKLKRMIKSFLDTSSPTTRLHIKLDIDDPLLNEYSSINNHDKIFIDISTREDNTKVFNRVFEDNPSYDYYQCANDDIIYHTKGWDDKLKTNGIAFGKDGFPNRIFPTFSVIHGDIVRALGWLQMPLLYYLYGDNVWGTIGYTCGCLYYKPDVFIEHKHFVVYPLEKDSISEFTNHKDMYNLDEKHFHKWLSTDCHNDIQKVRRVVYGKS